MHKKKRRWVIWLIIIITVLSYMLNMREIEMPTKDFEKDLKQAFYSGKYIVISKDTAYIRDSVLYPICYVYKGIDKINIQDKDTYNAVILYAHFKRQNITKNSITITLGVLIIISIIFAIGKISIKVLNSTKTSVECLTDSEGDTKEDNSEDMSEEEYINKIKNCFNNSNKDKKPLLKDVKGIDEILEEVEQIIDYLKNRQKYEQMGARLPKGLLLYGPPGTGKTMIAKAIANELDINFMYSSGSSFINTYVGVGAKNVRKLFKKAKLQAPAIIFIDEIDAIGAKRHVDTNTEYISTLEALLVELDGFDTRDGIFVIAATNRYEALDEALTRPGRFDKSIAVPLPDYKGRLEILENYSLNKPLAKDVSLAQIAKQTQGLTGAYLEAILNEAAIRAVRQNRTEITHNDLLETYYTIITKGKTKKKERREIEHKLIAYHEAGHALIAKKLLDEEVSKVTILGNTCGAGGLTVAIPNDINLYTKQELINYAIKLYAGRVAEEFLVGEHNVTIGAVNDIEKSTEIIYNMVVRYGLNKEHGLLNYSIINNGKLSDSILEEIKELSNSIYKQTYIILEKYKDLLDLIANELLEKETLTNEDLNKIIRTYEINKLGGLTNGIKYNNTLPQRT